MAESTPSLNNEYVILIHGLIRSSRSMKKLAIALEDEGYSTINVDYPSNQFSIEQLAVETINKALALCPKNAIIHFVTHSLGGILVRQYLSEHSIDNLGRVVMLGPPNKGSEIVDNLSSFPGFKLINGPAGLQLGTDEQSVPNKLGPVNFDLGIIAGTRNFSIYALMIAKPNDGKVSVESSKIEGMTDHIELAVSHSFMMNNSHVIANVIHFLQSGLFLKKIPDQN
ncbi:MAG: alpha/beta hydrolase [Gammaproteobacteria bacterium]|nr:MAG: alpha/beta hydrolase [Gammaproteobacteria bacterium]